MILGVQILVIGFCFFMAYLSFLHFKREEFSRPQVLFWEIIWSGLAFITLFPRTVNVLIQELGIARAMDLFMILGFMFLTILAFYNYIALGKLKKKLEQKTQEEALNSFENNRDK